jgi:hypothetical protein
MASRIACFVVPLLLCVGASGSAATIGFEGVVQPGEFVIPATPYTEQGYTLTDTGIDGIFSPGFGANDNGTSIFGWCSDCSGEQTLTLSAGGTAFSLYSLDAALLDFEDAGPQSLVLTGYFAAGGTISDTISLSGTWATFSLSGFNGLAAVSIQDTTPRHDPAIDNLNVTTLSPEPAAWLLLSTGLAALAAFRRRRRS